jgi:hypothetical protein
VFVAVGGSGLPFDSSRAAGGVDGGLGGLDLPIDPNLGPEHESISIAGVGITVILESR